VLLSPNWRRAGWAWDYLPYGQRRRRRAQAGQHTKEENEPGAAKKVNSTERGFHLTSCEPGLVIRRKYCEYMIAIDRITEDFVEDDVPPFPCPSCGDRLVARKNGCHFDLSKQSAFHWEFVDSDPTMVLGVFTLRLLCSRTACEESVDCVGSFITVQDSDPAGAPDYHKLLSPLYFVPPVHVFPLPPKLHDKVKKPLVDSFSMFWANPNAAANSLRISVEALMDCQRVKKWTTDKIGKTVEIKLHDRIIAFQKRAPDIGEKLLAIKWLGNSGSHLSGLEKKDVINGYRLYSYVLEEMFEKRSESLGKMAQRINRKKGPC